MRPMMPWLALTLGLAACQTDRPTAASRAADLTSGNGLHANLPPCFRPSAALICSFLGPTKGKRMTQINSQDR